jgi:hypothetical protein
MDGKGEVGRGTGVGVWGLGAWCNIVKQITHSTERGLGQCSHYYWERRLISLPTVTARIALFNDVLLRL